MRDDFFALPAKATPLERALTVIVRGQIRSFFTDHPLLAGRDLDVAISGISKRVVRDLACGDTTARLAPLFVEVGTAAAGNGGVETMTAPLVRDSVEPSPAEVA